MRYDDAARGRWGETIGVDRDADGNIWVFHRCFNNRPPGAATCVGRDDDPPVVKFSPDGELLDSVVPRYRNLGEPLFGGQDRARRALRRLLADESSWSRLPVPNGAHLGTSVAASTPRSVSGY